MAKNRNLLNQIQHPSFMSPSLPHTVAIVADDDDDNDICPVCDGECTCSNYHPTPSTSSAHPSPSSHDPPKPVLKIKLPSNLLQKRKSQTTPPSVRDAVSSASPIPELTPKRRGRPPKNPALRAAALPAGSYQRPKPKSAAHRNRPPSNKSTARAKAVKKRKRVDSSSSSSSELTDVDLLYSNHNPAGTGSSYNSYAPHSHDDDDDDAQSVQFPTFVSAISSASSSGSDTASLSGFETDSSIEAEEENFIRAEERARVRRELLNGAGEESLQRRRDNNWVIRPRKRSVGTPSDVDNMDVDSDATDDDDDDEEDEEDEDEPDGDETEDTDARNSYGYAGLVTAWSEDDEESSFDADLFFANLSDNESGSSGSSTQSDDGDDGDHSDLDFDLSETAASLIPHIRQGVGIGVPNLPFEVTEGWDGQVVFTNGLGESSLQSNLHGLLEINFLPSGPEASPSPGPDGDVDMASTTDADEEGYEQDVGLDTAEAEGDGDTTDEELVGEDNLPNERAMSLFNTPFSFSNVSAINPMSTMSPVASPGGPSVHKASSMFGGSKLDSPKPADILAGKMVYWGTDDHGEDFDDDDEESNVQKERREKEKEERGGFPRSGSFEVTEKARQAIIDDTHKDVPTSYPRYTSTRRGRGAKSASLSISHADRSRGFENLLRQSFQSVSLRPSSLPPPSSRETFSSVSAAVLPTSEMPVETTSTSCTSIISTEEPSTQPIAIDLDDVLDASFLAASEHLESSDIGMVDPVSGVKGADESSSSEARKHIKNLNRWDVISVGAFRKTRESCLSDGAAGWGSDSGAEYGIAHGNAIKSSPLSSMLWHHRHGGVAKQRTSAAASPELGPLRDGDRTPTDAHPKQNRSPFNNKTRKELRRERKLKRRSYGPVSHHQQYHHHHHHHHHPNSKSRSTGSSQRTNFFNAPVPSLNI